MKGTASKPKEREVRIALTVEEAQMLADILYDDSLTSENKDRINFAAECMSEITEVIEND